MKKSQVTKQFLMQRALELFEKRGYAKTTMRDLAEACGLSLGAFYYHFRSKDEVIFELFRSSLDGHVERTHAYLESAPKRLDTIMEWVCRDRLAEFASHRALIRVIAQRLDPDDPISPWSPAALAIRERSHALFAEITRKTLPGLDARTRELVAKILWLQHLLVLAAWAFDRSEGSKRTEELLTRSRAFWKHLPTALKIPGMKSAFTSLVGPLVHMVEAR